jgi:hypothetical protein
VIRILAEDDHSGGGERGEVKGGEHLVVRREHHVPFAFVTNEVL